MNRLLGRAADPKRKHPLYNTSPFTFQRLLGDPENIAPNLVSYINGFGTARKYRYAIPRPLAAPDGAIAGGLDRIDRERALVRLQLLQADDVRLGRCQPRQQARQPLVDVVDVEGRNFHVICKRNPAGAGARRGEV